MIYLGADHAGFEQKETIKKWFQEQGRQCIDLGATHKLSTDDYPRYALHVSKAVSKDPNNHVGFLFCGSGQGMAIVANKIPGIRAAICWDTSSARETRKDNNANVLSLASRFTPDDQAKRIIEAFLRTPFSNEERHARRIEQVHEIEMRMQGGEH